MDKVKWLTFLAHPVCLADSVTHALRFIFFQLTVAVPVLFNFHNLQNKP